MSIPFDSSIQFRNGARIDGLPQGIAPGQPTTFEQLTGGATYRAGATITAAINQSTFSAVAVVNSFVRAYPWRVLRPITIASLQYDVTTPVAASLARLGIYSDTGQGYPNALLAGSDVATIDCSTVALKPANTFATAISLAAGLYWIVENASGAHSRRVIPVAAIDPVLGNNNTASNNSGYTCWSAPLAFGPMPATYPTGASLVANVAAPVVYIKIN